MKKNIMKGRHNSNPFPALSPRETEVVDLLTLGKTTWDMSVILKISERTVNYHVNNIMQKLGVISRLQVVFEASHSYRELSKGE